MRCDRCGARNAEGAAWCTQCYTSFDDPPPTTAVADGPEAPPERQPAPLAPDGPSPAGASQAEARDVRVVDGAVEWRCRRCDGWSALTAPSCRTCGAPREGFGEERTSGPARTVAPAAAVGASVVVPGAGHLLVGRTGTGVARAVLWLLWLLPGVAALRGADGLGALPGVALVLGAAVLWAATLVDIRRVVEGDPRELLAPRMLAWLVGGVVLAVVASVFLVAAAAR